MDVRDLYLQRIEALEPHLYYRVVAEIQLMLTQQQAAEQAAEDREENGDVASDVRPT